MAMVQAEENIKVVIRIRPINEMEKGRGETSCVRGNKAESSEGDDDFEHNEVQVRVGPHDAHVYNCNRCFHPEVTQTNFFQECGLTGLLDSAIGGYRACAFAFGQTGAGKTHTIVGPGNSTMPGKDDDGILGNSLLYLYKKLNSLGVEYKLRLSCMEIYKEQVYDLLATGPERKVPLNVREHTTDGFFLEGCTMQPCRDAATACHALDVAMQHRRIAGHDMNSRSNRSHCLTDIFIELPGQAALQSIVLAHKHNINKAKAKSRALKQKQRGHTGGDEESEEEADEEAAYSFPGLEGIQKEMESDREYTVMGRITLVDLAGSENMKRTNSTGKAAQEAGFINKSLYVLGQVIQGLARTAGEAATVDVPFRDSKLTKLLISSLGGQSRTLLLACVAEASGSIVETLRTLKFSMNCARIKNRPVRFLDPQERIIMDLRTEIRKLRSENELLRKGITTQPQDASRASRGRGGRDDEEYADERSDHVMPMRRAASANPTLQPLKGKKSVKSSASMSKLSDPAAEDRSVSSRGRGRNTAAPGAANGRAASRSRSRSMVRGKKVVRKTTPPTPDSDEKSVRSSRSRQPQRGRLKRQDAALARNLGLPEAQLERVLNKKGGGSRLRAHIQGAELAPVRRSKQGSANSSYIDDAHNDYDDEDASVRRIRQLEERLRRIENEKGVASSDLLGVRSARSEEEEDAVVRRSRSRSAKQSPKKGSPRKRGKSKGDPSGKQLRLKKSQPHLNNIISEPSLEDLLSAAGADSGSDEEGGRGRKAKKMIRKIKGDNSSLSINSGGRFSSNQKRAASRSVTRRGSGSRAASKQEAPSTQAAPRSPAGRGRSSSRARPVAQPEPKKSPTKSPSKKFNEQWKRKKSDPQEGNDDWGRMRKLKNGAGGAKRVSPLKEMKSANTSSPYIYHLVGDKGLGGDKKKRSPEEIRLLKANIESGKISGEIAPAKNVSDLLTNMTKRRLMTEHEKYLDATEYRKQKDLIEVETRLHYEVTPDFINPRHVEASLKAASGSPADKQKLRKKKKKPKTRTDSSTRTGSSGSGDSEISPDVSPPMTPPATSPSASLKKATSPKHTTQSSDHEEDDGYGDEEFEKEYGDDDFEEEEEGEDKELAVGSAAHGGLGLASHASVMSSGEDDSVNALIDRNMAHHTAPLSPVSTPEDRNPAPSPKHTSQHSGGHGGSPKHSTGSGTKHSAHTSPHKASPAHGKHSYADDYDEYSQDNVSPPVSPPEPVKKAGSPSQEKPYGSPVHASHQNDSPGKRNDVHASKTVENSPPADSAPAYGIYDDDGIEASHELPPTHTDSLADSLGLPVEKRHVSKGFYTKGEVVEGNYRTRDKWYPGVIGRAFPDGTYEVDYDDGEQERLEKAHIRAIVTASSIATAAAPAPAPYQPSGYAPAPIKASGMSYGSNDDDDGYSFGGGASKAAAPAPAPAPYKASGMSYGSNDDNDSERYSFGGGMSKKPIANNPFKLDSDSDSEEISHGGGGGGGNRGWGNPNPPPAIPAASALKSSFSSNISPDADIYDDDDAPASKPANKWEGGGGSGNAGSKWESGGGSSTSAYGGLAHAELDTAGYDESFDDYDDEFTL